MNILLFSNDQKLAAFCEDILTEVFGVGSKVKIGIPGQSAAQEDLCLWDFIPGETAIPRDFETARFPRHLFLLHRRDLPVLQELLRTSDINVLLKPVMPATLRAFLGDARRQPTYDFANPPKSVQALRVERDSSSRQTSDYRSMTRREPTS